MGVANYWTQIVDNYSWWEKMRKKCLILENWVRTEMEYHTNTTESKIKYGTQQEYV